MGVDWGVFIATGIPDRRDGVDNGFRRRDTFHMDELLKGIHDRVLNASSFI